MWKISFKGVYQVDEMDCGPAVLSTILKVFGSHIPLYKIKKEMSTTLNGTSIQDIVDAAHLFGVDAEGMKGDYTDLKESISNGTVTFPFVAHTIKDQSFAHFIVVKRINKKYFYVFDPGIGNMKISIEEFILLWTGHLINFRKSSTYKKIKVKIDTTKTKTILMKNRSHIANILVFTGVLSIMSIVSTNLYRTLIDNHILKKITVQRDGLGSLFSTIIGNKSALLASILLIYIFQSGLSFFSTYLSAKVEKNIESDFRKEFYKKIFSLKIWTFSIKKTGDFLTRLHDIEIVSSFLASIIIALFSNIFMFAIGGWALANISVRLFIITCTILLLYTLVVKLSTPYLTLINRQQLENQSKIISSFKESVDNIESIKSFQMENLFNQKLVLKTNTYINKKFQSKILSTIFSTIINNIEQVGSIIILWIGSTLIINGALSLGEFIAFESLMVFFISPIKNLAILQISTQEYVVSYERLQEFYDFSSEEHFKDNTINRKNIAFEKVSLSYPDGEFIFDNISFMIQEGEKIFISGVNGSGKSSLAKIMNKFILPNGGQVYLDGIPYHKLSITDIRNQVIYSSQDSQLFSGSLKENLFIETLTPSHLSMWNKILESGMLDNLQPRLDNGWNSVIAEGGVNLSGGQQQLVILCRALLMDASIYIFDESMSQMDSYTREKALNFIFKEFHNKTLIFIDHGLNIKKRCSRTIEIPMRTIDSSELVKESGI